MSSELEASVVLATYNRKEPLRRVLTTLARQSLPRSGFEVIVVDDGSEEDATPTAMAFADALRLRVHRQTNTGVARARQNGVERAQGRIVIFLDDDMLAAPNFVAEHVRLHRGQSNRVVMGELLAAPNVEMLPLFERYHAHMQAQVAQRFAETGTFAGHEVYTGNLSMPRDLFFRAGGFDPAFHIEDVELGVRLEQAGAHFVFSRAVATVHASDHTSLDAWLARSVKDGRDWVRLTRKHPTMPMASPWRFLSEAHPAARLVFAAALVAPKAAPALARFALFGAQQADRSGFRRAMLSAMTLVYGLEFFEGVRLESGSLRSVLDEFLDWRQTFGRGLANLA